ncbi:GGACT [Cordylochernes scorpioides]|nr:GGACT [Cordylochernes scorpioides]
MSSSSPDLVFVYGTLKSGEPNHDLIKSSSTGARLVGRAKTCHRWPLIIASRYNIPYLLHCRDKGEHVLGEVYEVDDDMLAKLDELECHPDYYTRRKEPVHLLSTSTEITPWIYFLRDYKPELLDFPMLSEYFSIGTHGKPYVPRYLRPSDPYHSDVQNS